MEGSLTHNKHYMNQQTILELKSAMKTLASINDGVSERNKEYLKNACENIKELIEIIS